MRCAHAGTTDHLDQEVARLKRLLEQAQWSESRWAYVASRLLAESDRATALELLEDFDAKTCHQRPEPDEEG